MPHAQIDTTMKIQPQTSQEQEEKEVRNLKQVVKRKRKPHNLCLFWSSLFSMLLITVLNFPMFFSDNLTLNTIITSCVVIFCFVVFIVNSFKIGETIKDICALYFMLDTIGVSKVSAIVGLVGMLTIVMPPHAYVVVVSTFYCIDVFLLGANFKIILAYCEYRKWQVISCKMTIGFCCIIYMSLAAYFMRNNFDNLPINKQAQQAFQEYFLLYVFGLFTLYYELLNKMCEFDGTNRFQYYYLMNDDEEIEVPLKEEIEEEKPKIAAKKEKNGQGKEEKMVKLQKISSV